MRKRSKYRPHGVNPEAWKVAMLGSRVLTTDDALKRAEVLRLAVEEACKGQATHMDWRTIFDCVNVAEQLCKHRVVQGSEAIDSLQVTIEAIHDRQRITKTRALYPAEMAELRDFAADYADILAGVTNREYMEAQRGVEDRIRRILSTERIPASVRIVEAA